MLFRLRFCKERAECKREAESAEEKSSIAEANKRLRAVIKSIERTRDKHNGKAHQTAKHRLWRARQFEGRALKSETEREKKKRVRNQVVDHRRGHLDHSLLSVVNVEREHADSENNAEGCDDADRDEERLAESGVRFDHERSEEEKG